jgi:hypothetical protein
MATAKAAQPENEQPGSDPRARAQETLPREFTGSRTFLFGAILYATFVIVVGAICPICHT